MSPTIEGRPQGAGVHVALVVSRFNEPITRRLLAGAHACLDHHGSDPADRTVVHVPGAWEIPLAARRLADPARRDVVVGLGALIRGQTPHFDYIAQEVARGLGRVAADTGVPTIFGVLTTNDPEQAMARSESDSSRNKGWEAVLAALELVDVLRQIDT